MNFRHAASLALVGWFLMQPPIGSVDAIRNPSTGFYEAHSTLPFCAWEREDEYDTSEECRVALDQANQRAKVGCPDCTVIAVCVAAGDPRLKSK
jgi:hypothetical protein